MQIQSWLRLGTLAFFVARIPIAFAEGDPNTNLQKFKTEASADIEEHSQKLQEHKSCINNATTKEAVQSCRDNMRQWRQGQRAEHLDKHKARLEQRLQNVQQKQDHMNRDPHSENGAGNTNTH